MAEAKPAPVKVQLPAEPAAVIVVKPVKKVPGFLKVTLILVLLIALIGLILYLFVLPPKKSSLVPPKPWSPAPSAAPSPAS
jgi:hypothetical protein